MSTITIVAFFVFISLAAVFAPKKKEKPIKRKYRVERRKDK